MSESIRQQLERFEEEQLAPYAQRSRGAARRHPIENEGRAWDYRTAFQRDRDRIVYSRAFRRLRQKAQSGVLPAYEDHRRNRLTHTLEVAQLARTIGRALRLNEDLIEATALGHDLGQPPFGPAGERALDDLLSGRLDGRGGPGLGDVGGFSRAWQSLRVVDGIEARYAHPGLNLTDAVREGIVKSAGSGSRLPEGIDGVREGAAPPFEAQVVAIADRIATALHALDDALQAATLELGPVERLVAVQRLRARLGPDFGARGGRFLRAAAIHRGLVQLFVTAAVQAASRGLPRWAERHGVRTVRDFELRREAAVSGQELGLPPAAETALADLEGFVEARVHRTQVVERAEGRAWRVLHGLLAAYLADPRWLEDHVLLRVKERLRARFLRDVPRAQVETELERYRSDPRFVRLVADYLATMTDSYALREHARLLESGAVPLPSVEQLRRERARGTARPARVARARAIDYGTTETPGEGPHDRA